MALPILVVRMQLHVFLNFHIRKMGHLLISDRFLEIWEKNHSPFFSKNQH